MRRAVVSLILSAAAVPIAHAQVTANVPSRPAAGAQTNNPVSMVIEHKTVQTLADGTHITNVSHELFYRDSLGRTRTEIENIMPPAHQPSLPHSVSVTDPVAGLRTLWITGDETVEKLYTRFPIPVRGQSAALRSAPRPAPAATTHPPAQVMIEPPHTLPGMPEKSAAQKAAAQSDPYQPVIKQEDLGAQTVQGVVCQAHRTTTTYPEGYLNNDRAITVTTETCVSRELGRIVMEKIEDPRNGIRTTTLKSISRAEPDVSLFQPPPDYTERPKVLPPQPVSSAATPGLR